MHMGEPIGQITTGVILVITPAWASFLADFNLLAATIASICGAVIGIYGIVRICKNRSKEG